LLVADGAKDGGALVPPIPTVRQALLVLAEEVRAQHAEIERLQSVQTENGALHNRVSEWAQEAVLRQRKLNCAEREIERLRAEAAPPTTAKRGPVHPCGDPLCVVCGDPPVNQGRPDDSALRKAAAAARDALDNGNPYLALAALRTALAAQ
jgi:hypothetical protein